MSHEWCSKNILYLTQQSECAWIDLIFLITGTYQLPTLFLCSHMFLCSIINCSRLPISGWKGIIGYLANHFLCFNSDGDTIFNPVRANSSSHRSCTLAGAEWAERLSLHLSNHPVSESLSYQNRSLPWREGWIWTTKCVAVYTDRKGHD